MSSSFSWLFPLLAALQCVVVNALHTQIPSIRSFTESNSSSPFVITPQITIVVDSKFQDSGSPGPSLLSFARTFRLDLVAVTGFDERDVPEVRVGSAPSLAPDQDTSSRTTPTVFLTLGADASNLKLFKGEETGEGYEFEITSTMFTIRGVEAIGAWWGTRTLLQQALLSLSLAASNETSSIPISSGSGFDAPGWEIRGFMLDVGRHWFELSFLSDLCIYASFFKMNEFHVHASDFVIDEHAITGRTGSPSPDAWKSLYATLRFQPSLQSPIIGIIAPFANETYSHSSFSTFQSTCLQHGITIIPEIDTPAHSVVISKWKPELAIPGQEDFLNISFPETIPTVQSIWEEFLPWFSTNSEVGTGVEVSIGADEYSSSLADDYILFVNTMNDYISSTSEKAMRIWGTNEPSRTGQTISTNVTIQHWSFPGGSIPVRLMEEGYRVINSEQAFLYLIGKSWSDGVSKFDLDSDDTIWTGAPNGGGWAPNIFSQTDSSNNTTPSNPLLRGSIMACWNDFGNNATTPLELWYQLRKSLPLVGEKMWAGADGVPSSPSSQTHRLTQDEFNQVYPILNKGAPGQNLNRAVKGLSAPATVYQFQEINPTHLVKTGVDSVGPPYTLSFDLRLANSSNRRGNGHVQIPLFTGIDSVLFLDIFPSPSTSNRDSNFSLTFQDPVTNKFYPLSSFGPPTLPGVPVQISVPFNSEEFTKVVISATERGTSITIGTDEDDGVTRFWESVIGISGDHLRLVNMSFAAPAAVIGDEGLTGEMRNVRLRIGDD
ncbi:hypothetical protein D9758_014524 [Tetrapyrgos nigripes]|uniref:beta-N-acetylhexosaminidase n=1 Tax=Tetrapyrgos nigripes TaxID=182062 RepID=A0A8H5FS22_9AGAR|nr:hypothetical protein D9758_014524 [Tetrapyrgos nigripes]